MRRRIEVGLREAIRSGRLPRGTRLPATRELARDLGVSRGTVLQAYDQLAAEGWIRGRRGASTVVAVEAESLRRAPAIREAPATRWRFDLRPGRPDPSAFPRSLWLRAARGAIASAPADAFGPGDPQGQLSLRSELAGYLNRARGLQTSPDQVVVTTGFTQGLGLVARAVRRAGGVAMEDPSMPLHRAVVRAAGHPLLSIPVDREGMRIEELEGSHDVALAVLTPNRQHPTGGALSPQRRARLLAWARTTGSMIVEDDYDGEFRYDRRPIGALQSLDPDGVVYAGTLSKTLGPGVRLGWLVVPDRLRGRVLEQKALADWHSAGLDQLTFTEMLRSGAYDRHVRRMRLVYRRRRDAVLGALGRFRPELVPTGTEAGLNLMLPLPDASAEAALVAAAARAGVGIHGLVTGGYYEHGGAAGLIIGYGAALGHSFSRAVETLVELLAGSAPGAPEAGS